MTKDFTDMVIEIYKAICLMNDWEPYKVLYPHSYMYDVIGCQLYAILNIPDLDLANLDYEDIIEHMHCGWKLAFGYHKLIKDKYIIKDYEKKTDYLSLLAHQLPIEIYKYYQTTMCIYLSAIGKRR